MMVIFVLKLVGQDNVVSAKLYEDYCCSFNGSLGDGKRLRFQFAKFIYLIIEDWPNEYLTSDSALAIRFKAIKPEDYKIPSGGNDEVSANSMVRDDNGTDFIREVQGGSFLFIILIFFNSLYITDLLK